LRGSVWVGRTPMENNIWAKEAYRLINQPYFASLNRLRQERRFSIYGYNSPLMSPDVRFLTSLERQNLIDATAVIVFGANFAETVQLSAANTYYFCVPWSPTLAQVLGYETDFMRGKCFIAHAPRGTTAYQYQYRAERFETFRERREKRLGLAVENS
ncbi:MAG: hypothetical protein PHH14_02925, partial [Candidatus Margulisbacteria bacterium]|nr:hypothetical protein [Candidatus Margulisiibacteriota bacterium]